MFRITLNGPHLSLTFTMELPVDDRIPFIGIEIINKIIGTKLESIESQPILACCCIFIVILTNAMKTLY